MGFFQNIVEDSLSFPVFVFFIGWTAFFIYTEILFFSNRNSIYIVNRNSVLLIFSAFGQYLMMTSLTLKIIIKPENFENIIDHWFIWFMVPLHFLPYPVRSIRFNCMYLISLDDQDPNNTFSGIAKFIRRHRMFFTDSAFIIFNCFLMCLSIVWALVRQFTVETNLPGHKDSSQTSY